MIKLFRTIRRQLLGEGKTAKYFKYAVGEILLVMIGILLALQVSNWNQDRKDRSKERIILSEIKSSLESDLSTYSQFYHPRFERRKQGLNFLKHASYNNIVVPNDTVIQYFNWMGIDIFFRYDNGPFDALKTQGFELITKPELRKDIIQNYEVFMPAFTRFINGFVDYYAPSILTYEKTLISSKVMKIDSNTYKTTDIIKVDDILHHPSFLELLSIQEHKYENYVRRINQVEDAARKLIEDIDEELNKN